MRAAVRDALRRPGACGRASPGGIMADGYSAMRLSAESPGMVSSAHQPERSRPLETFRPQNIEFVGEKTGQAEDDLKARFRQVFSGCPAVRRAYLARLSYGEPTSRYSVTLCILSTSGPDHSLLAHLGRIFAEMFNEAEHLDMMFMGDDQERQLKAVCRPFYEAFEGT